MKELNLKKFRIFLLTAFCLSAIACTDHEHTIKIKGSDTEVNLAVNLAERFADHHPEYNLSVSGGGSGLGIASLLNGQADIANSSRPLTDDEIALFKKKSLRIKTVVFAEDATAFVVNADNPLTEIDITTLGNILSGKTNSWKSVSGQNLPVNIYGRQSSSGTYSFVKGKLNINYSPKAKEMTGNAQILEGLKMDRSGIGYVGAGYISKNAHANEGIKVLKIKATAGAAAVSPLDTRAITESRYFFQRPLYQFIPAESWEKVQPFILFETKGEGRHIISSSGYYLINKK